MKANISGILPELQGLDIGHTFIISSASFQSRKHYPDNLVTYPVGTLEAVSRAVSAVWIACRAVELIGCVLTISITVTHKTFVNTVPTVAFKLVC